MTINDFDEPIETHIPSEYLCARCGVNEGLYSDDKGELICEDCE